MAPVEQGHRLTAAAQRLCVSIKFVNDMVRLKRETGALAPKPQGNPGRGKLTDVKDWVQRRIAARPDLTIDELTAELAAGHGLQVHRSSVGRLLLCIDPVKICSCHKGEGGDECDDGRQHQTADGEAWSCLGSGGNLQAA
ncbi:MAG: transposase [Gemmobacter sp.]